MAVCEPFDAAALPRPFGLNNTGVICHFNSLLQGLATCPAFISAVTGNVSYMSRTATGGALYNFARAVKESADREGFVVDPSHSERAIRALVGDLRRRRPNIGFGSGMESASEGLALLLDMCEPESGTSTADAARADAVASAGQATNPVSAVFMQRTVVQTWCEQCHRRGRRGPDVPARCKPGVVAYRRDISYQRHFFNHTPDLKTPAGFARALVSTVDALQDYKCEACEAAGDDPKKGQVYRSYRMMRAPPVLQVVFNQYAGHTWHYFPHLFRLRSGAGGHFVYRAVAQVEHSGTLSGGHYWAKALRRAPPGGLAKYTLNDSMFSPAGPQAIAPSAQTYMVFYHFDREEAAEAAEGEPAAAGRG